MFPFRIGTTSYILPDDILPNVRFLADRVQDVELVLFEVEEGGGNLLSASVVDELRSIALAGDLTYTVHLPLDLRLSARGSARHASLIKAERVFRRTRALGPWAYVLHLDGTHAGTDPRWGKQAAEALEIVAAWVDSPRKLAVENLEGYPLEMIEPVLDLVPVARCVDVGHLWLDGHDAIRYLSRNLENTRVVHMHGIAERDHQSLVHVPRQKLEAVIRYLTAEGFDGVLTIEVFNQSDLESSLGRLAELAVD
jgi:sugar phosphate isomerase/epimerase